MVHSMKIYSSSLHDGWFSVECGGHGRNLSPAFEVIDAPEGTVSLALLFEDRDAFPVTGGFSWVHWAACNIGLPGLWENASADGGHFVQGVNSYISVQGGSMPREECIGYCGMSPPDDDHVYTLHVYALDTRLDIENGFDMNIMFRKMTGHILAEAQLEGYYRKM